MRPRVIVTIETQNPEVDHMVDVDLTDYVFGRICRADGAGSWRVPIGDVLSAWIIHASEVLKDIVNGVPNLNVVCHRAEYVFHERRFF